MIPIQNLSYSPGCAHTFWTIPRPLRSRCSAAALRRPNSLILLVKVRLLEQMIRVSKNSPGRAHTRWTARRPLWSRGSAAVPPHLSQARDHGGR